MEEARLAVASDLVAIEMVAEKVRSEASGARGGSLFLVREGAGPPLEERLRLAITEPNAVAVVGCYDGVVFGYGLATIERLADDRLIAVVDQLAVEHDARKVGIGEAMMNLLIDEAKALGCVGIDSWALPGDRHTKNFFESFGLKARLLIVHRSFES